MISIKNTLLSLSGARDITHRPREGKHETEPQFCQNKIILNEFASLTFSAPETPLRNMQRLKRIWLQPHYCIFMLLFFYFCGPSDIEHRLQEENYQNEIEFA